MHERRTHDAPQRHQGELFVAREMRRAPAQIQHAQRQHVRIRPVTRTAKRIPVSQPRELFMQRRPIVPEIIADAPEVGVLHHVFGSGQRSFARRQTQHHRSPRSINRAADGFNLLFIRVIGSAQIVHLHVIHTPRRDQFKHRIVIRLRARLAHVHTEHIGIPFADAVRIRDVARAIARALDQRIFAHRLSRNAAHQMNSKLQSEAVNIITECFETDTVGR